MTGVAAGAILVIASASTISLITDRQPMPGSQGNSVRHRRRWRAVSSDMKPTPQTWCSMAPQRRKEWIDKGMVDNASLKTPAGRLARVDSPAVTPCPGSSFCSSSFIGRCPGWTTSRIGNTLARTISAGDLSVLRRLCPLAALLNGRPFFRRLRLPRASFSQGSYSGASMRLMTAIQPANTWCAFGFSFHQPSRLVFVFVPAQIEILVGSAT